MPSDPTGDPALNGETADTDDPRTPRASITVDENYFPPLPPRPLAAVPPRLFSRPPSAASLSAKATIAISLPEGVYAQQQDGVSTGGSSVTSAPSFSDTNSVTSLAPTLEAGENDVESMLGEILAEDETARFGDGVLRDFEEPAAVYDSDSGSDESDSNLETDEEKLDEETVHERFCRRSRHYFILSSAGKPIYSHHGSESLISSYMGIIQTILSFFSTSNDTLHAITSGTHTFTTLSLSPLYMLSITTTPHPPHLLQTQLSSLHSVILSTLTAPAVSRAFSNRENFDLRRLLGGTDVFLSGLISHFPLSPSHLLSALEPLPLPSSTRSRISNLLLVHRAPSLLYGLILAPHRLVSVVRPSRHSLHPSDLQLVFNMLYNATTFRAVGSEHWTPLCLPRFNSRGFLHVYIHFFTTDLCIVLVSADKVAFFALREMREKVLSELDVEGLQVHTGRYQCPAKGVRHFLFKSRANVQFTMPAGLKRQEMALYRRLVLEVGRRGVGGVRVVFLQGRLAGMAWIAGEWEVYGVTDGGVGREEVGRRIREVARWGRKEEAKGALWVAGGAVF